MIAALAFLLTSQTSCSVVFVRHGETEANATGHYSEKTLNLFSALGSQEVATLTRTLLGSPKFDGILVSPAPRTLATIAPYLRATHQKALIWPLLYECCTGRRPANAHPTPFGYGSVIKIPPAYSTLFSVLPKENRLPIAPDYDRGLSQVDAAVKEFVSRFSHGRVLMVGHSGMGGHFIHALTGRWQKLDNAKPYRFTVGG